MDLFLMNLINGIAFGMLLFLLSAGLTVKLGVMGVADLSHGALYTLGAFVGWTVLISLGLNYWLAVLAAGMASGVIGLVIERGFLRRLYKQPNDQVLLTLGFVYILGNLITWIWGDRAKVPFTASFLSGSIQLGFMVYPVSRIMIIGIGLVMAVGLWLMQDKTRIGAIIRAGMDDKEMTAGIGINFERVSIAVFFLTAFIAGLAGIIGAPVLGADASSAFNIVLLAMIVIIIGGAGTIQGALVGSLLIGLINIFGAAMFPQFAMFTMYLAMIIILVIRPQGILGRRV